MAFDYISPGASEKDRIRFLIGDRFELRHGLEDEEIAALIDLYGSWQAAVIPAVDALIATASQRGYWATGGESESPAQAASALRDLRAQLVAAGYPEPAAVTGTSPDPVRRLRRAADPTAEYTS